MLRFSLGWKGQGHVCKVKMLPAVSASVAEVTGPSINGYEQQARLWSQAKRSAALVLEMDAVARRVRLAAKNKVMTNTGGSGRASDILRD